MGPSIMISNADAICAGAIRGRVKPGRAPRQRIEHGWCALFAELLSGELLNPRGLIARIWRTRRDGLDRVPLGDFILWWEILDILDLFRFHRIGDHILGRGRERQQERERGSERRRVSLHDFFVCRVLEAVTNHSDQIGAGRGL